MYLCVFYIYIGRSRYPSFAKSMGLEDDAFAEKLWVDMYQLRRAKIS